MVSDEGEGGGLKEGSMYPYFAIKISPDKMRELKNLTPEILPSGESVYSEDSDGNFYLHIIWR